MGLSDFSTAAASAGEYHRFLRQGLVGGELSWFPLHPSLGWGPPVPVPWVEP